MTKKPESVKMAENILSELEKEERDLFLYSGGVDYMSINKLLGAILTKKKRHPNVSLILTTWGGDAHQAYRMARFLQKCYPKAFRVVVFGPCKSAGTLVTTGANELAFGLLGELGPLDVQLTKSDEIAVTNSGLDTLGALAIMRGEAFNAFEEYMIGIVGKSGGTVSMKTASDVAVQLVIGLFQPMVQQIDPHRLSEVNRIMKIAREYGKRLGMPNLKNDKESYLDRLIEGYPAHGFIIDKEEAETIFEKVLDASELEQNAMMFYSNIAATPSEETIIIDIGMALQGLVVETDGENMLKCDKESMGNETTKEQGGKNRERASRKGSAATSKRTPRGDQAKGEKLK